MAPVKVALVAATVVAALRALVMSAKVVLTTALPAAVHQHPVVTLPHAAPLHVVISHPALTLLPVAILAHRVVISLLPVVISQPRVVTSQPVNLHLASPLVLPNRVMAVKCLCRATLRSVLPATPIK
jgi:hypothetical protein